MYDINNLKLVSPTDPVLLEKCKPWDFLNPEFDLVEFSKNLVKFMYDNNGIGIAANQVGIPYRIFAMRGQPENFVCINPRIVDTSTETIVMDEGCLTYPGVVVKIKRPRHVKIRFDIPNGDTLTKQFTGMTARVVQHEYDHLEGLVFYNKASLFHREKALKKFNFY